MEPQGVNWAELKRHLAVGAQLKYIESDDAYQVFAIDPPFILSHNIVKDAGAEQTDFETNFKADAVLNSQVTTAQEKSDKDLVLASDEQPFVGTTCTLSVEIPGAVGNMDGRLIAGGYGFTDVFGWGDRVSDVRVVDKDFVYAGIAYPATPTEAGIPGVEGLSWADIQPNGVVMGSYVDGDVPEPKRGWRFWADDGGQGGVDIDPLGGFGHLPGAAFLEIVMEKKSGNPAAFGAVNLWWGKRR